MGKKDKEYNARLEGMWSAYEIVSKQGKDALKEFLIKRGYYGVDVRLSPKDYEECMKALSQVMYNNNLACTAYTLNQEFGFGKDRLKRFKSALDKSVADTFDWNFMCKQYVTMEDYAVYINKLFDLGINVEQVGANEDSFQKRREAQESYKLDFTKGIINTLKLNGYKEASEFLEGKLKQN